MFAQNIRQQLGKGSKTHRSSGRITFPTLSKIYSKIGQTIIHPYNSEYTKFKFLLSLHVIQITCATSFLNKSSYSCINQFFIHIKLAHPLIIQYATIGNRNHSYLIQKDLCLQPHKVLKSNEMFITVNLLFDGMKYLHLKKSTHSSRLA
jgi:hypothetical protein